MEGYRYVVEPEVRFRDLDLMGHVNNAVYATYLEQARVEYYRDVIDADVDELGFVLAHVELDFSRPIEYGDKVLVGVRTTRVGERSMTTAFRVEGDGELAAEGETVQVAVDEDGGTRPVPEDWRRDITEFEERLEDGQ